ncbi:MAG: hypothetical protein PHU23_05830, partial [Dehalococcoidales bacterium]|nr:hypothetical protein [Dehalococcoidales bacterium]
AIPCTHYDGDDLERIRQYVSRGNTLVLMDYFGSGNQVLEYLGIPARFSQDILLDPLFCYKNPRLPRITDFSPELREQGIQAVVLNRGTFLDGVEDAAALAWSSPKSYGDSNGSEKWDEGDTCGPLVVAAEYRLGDGTVTIVADASLIINTMVSQNDNYPFVRHLIYSSGTPEAVILDRSHLSLTPLDAGKINLETARRFVSHPFVLLLVVAFIFALAARYTLKKEELIG